MKKILFLTGTRADYGKIKSILQALISRSDAFEIHLFVTGMHMLAHYGSTYLQLLDDHCFHEVYLYINQNRNDTMDAVLSKTISGFSDFVKELRPDMIVVHGDRIEALAGATVGALNNILVAHIEGGEVSGTVDGMLRHAISKLSHFHFVANKASKKRLQQLGEKKEHIFVIGSPDLDIMSSDQLPSIASVRSRYDITAENYSILMLHPVTTEIDELQCQVEILIQTLLMTERHFIVIHPNNDLGSDIILSAYRKIKSCNSFQFFPSMRFEYFLTLLKHADFMIGNSSAGVREAPYFGIPSINLGTRQHQRAMDRSIVHCDFEQSAIRTAIGKIASFSTQKRHTHSKEFGDGKSAVRCGVEVLTEQFWRANVQKHFVDLDDL